MGVFVCAYIFAQRMAMRNRAGVARSKGHAL